MKLSFRLRSLLLPLLTLLLTAGSTSCRDNKFTLEGNLSGGNGSTIYLSWRAASAKQDFMASHPIPLSGSPFKVEGPVKFPTVIWVFSSGQQLLSAIYAERGNHLTLSGKLSDPSAWQIEGNSVMEALNPWMTANAQLLAGGSKAEANRAVAAYVKAHPSDRSSLFLLLTRYNRKANQKEFDALLAGFKDEKMKEEMFRACLEPSGSTQLPVDRKARIRRMLTPKESIDSVASKIFSSTLNPDSSLIP